MFTISLFWGWRLSTPLIENPACATTLNVLQMLLMFLLHAQGTIFCPQNLSCHNLALKIKTDNFRVIWLFVASEVTWAITSTTLPVLNDATHCLERTALISIRASPVWRYFFRSVETNSGRRLGRFVQFVGISVLLLCFQVSETSPEARWLTWKGLNSALAILRRFRGIVRGEEKIFCWSQWRNRVGRRPWQTYFREPHDDDSYYYCYY